ncbi:MAG: hypothetical protein K8R21_08915, partial [Leptospira sp.]|nr:hypothetical protein [Leptospira sp.]
MNPSNRKQITWLILIFVALGLLVNYSRPGKPRTRLILPRTEKIVKKITQAIPDKSFSYNWDSSPADSEVFLKFYYEADGFDSTALNFCRYNVILISLLKGRHIDLPPPL